MQRQSRMEGILSYNKGDNVIYKGSEVCCIGDITTMSFDGVNEVEYYVLNPVGKESEKYYLPVAVAEDKLRTPLTPDEVNSLIDGMKTAKPLILDMHKKDRFAGLLNTNDHQQLISLLHTLYLERQERLSSGKKLTMIDEKALRTAQSLIEKEFAFVLGIAESEVDSYIRNRIE